MNGKPDPLDLQLERIAAALERLAPAQQAEVDWQGAAAFFKQSGLVHTIPELEAQPLERLRGIDEQKQSLLDNLTRLAKGAAAHDMLLWGARGMGKSALIRSCVQQIGTDLPGRLALVQISSDDLEGLFPLIAQLGGIDRAFVMFIDDLSFDADDAKGALALRSLLDGSALPRPANIRIAITSNRRAVIEREGEEVHAMHERDERDNALALADRFGLTLGFHPCNQDTYLEILRAYTEPLGLAFEEEEARAWVIARGNRSGRTAYQFACELAGRAGLAL